MQPSRQRASPFTSWLPANLKEAETTEWAPERCTNTENGVTPYDGGTIMSARFPEHTGEDISRRVLEAISEYELFAPGERVVVGLSGGPDSVALLHVLLELTRSGAFPLDLVAAHMNHSLRRGAADADQRFCEEMAAQCGLRCVTRAIPVQSNREKGESVEQAARRLRYDFLLRVAGTERAATVAVAHHADDVAETLLLRMLRGCGLYGLAAVAPARPVQSGSDVSLVRPLLHLQKRELVDYLCGMDVPYRIDSSNADIQYRRNDLRAHLIPALQEAGCSGLTARLSRINSLACAARYRLETLADAHWERVLCGRDARGVSFYADRLLDLSPPLRTALFRRAIQGLSGREHCAPGLQREHWRGLDAMLRRPPGAALSLPGKLTARREHGSIYIFCAEQERHTDSVPLPVPGRSGPVGAYQRISAVVKTIPAGAGLPDIAGEQDPFTARLDADHVPLPLKLRTRRAGDRFHPLGAPGGRKLKRFLIDRKIPLRERDRMVLVIDARGRIVWVAGEEIADFCKLTTASEDIIELHATPG